MGVHFRAWDFGGRTKEILFVHNGRGFLCGVVLLRKSFCLLWCDSILYTENSSQRRLLVCLAPRRVHFALPWTQAFEPALTDSTIRASAIVSNTAQVSAAVEVLILIFVNLIGKKSKLEVPFGFRVFVLFAANTHVVSFVLFFFHESNVLSSTWYYIFHRSYAICSVFSGITKNYNNVPKRLPIPSVIAKCR